MDFAVDLRDCFRYVLFIVITLFILPLNTLAATPTAEQLKMLEQLSPEQRAAALKTFQGRSGGKSIDAKPLLQPEVVKPRILSEKPSVIEEAVIEPGQKERSSETQKDPVQRLKQFGYDLFAGSPTTFAPATDIPVPTDYVVGPGDTVQVQLFGKENAEYDLIVTREGMLHFPGLGPIVVAGLYFNELRENLYNRIHRQMIGIKANITMGVLRSVRIFVLGEAIRPGSYTVSALSNMTNALFVNGGIKPIGSLRDIQLKRNGRVIGRLDLYDLLLHGDTRGDLRLQPGDVIFIPPIGATVGIAGEVRRPAIYELKSEQNVLQVLALSGGLLPTAYTQSGQLKRINRQGERTLIDLNLTDGADLSTRVHEGDVIRVYSVLEKMENVVTLRGHIQRPGGYQWHQGMRLTDLLPSFKDLLARPDLDYALISREMPPDRRIEVIATRLGEALANPDSDYNILLAPKDEVLVFGLGETRSQALEPLLQQLQNQAKYYEPEKVATISGNVRYTGVYPLQKNMRIRDLVYAAYDILPQTDMNYALLSREKFQGEQIETLTISLRDIISRKQVYANILLRPKDHLYVFNLEDTRQELIEPLLQQLKQNATHGRAAPIVTVSGLVQSQGRYPLGSDMRISDLIIAAGKLTEAAYAVSAEVSRQLIVDGEFFMTEHLPVDLAKALAGNEQANFILQPHDHLHIKQIPQWAEQRSVQLKGEFRFPGEYPIRQGETLTDLVVRAGGLTEHAYLQGAVFMREELRQREQKQLDTMIVKLEADIAAMSMEKNNNKVPEQTAALGLSYSFLEQLKSTQPVGRLVIELDELLANNQDEKYHVILKNGDKLFVPAYTQEVTVIGEVQYTTSHLYDDSLSRDDYINMSGGLTYKADDDRIYIVRANGAVIADGDGWLQSAQIRPGDTVVVPLEADRVRPLTLMTSITQIIYQLGVAAASWNAVGVF